MHKKFKAADKRLIDKIPTELWQLILSYLAIRDILPHVPRCCKFFQDEVVWGKWSGALLWREMAPNALYTCMFRDNYSGYYGIPALFIACAQNAQFAHVMALLSGGANVNAVDRDGNTTLYVASRGGHEKLVRKLLETNVDPNIANNQGWTPLITASFHGRADIAAILVASGVNIDHRSSNSINGSTALIWASIQNRVDVVRVLVNARADINIMNYFGSTALDIARNSDNAKITHILEQAGAQNPSSGRY